MVQDCLLLMHRNFGINSIRINCVAIMFYPDRITITFKCLKLQHKNASAQTMYCIDISRNHKCSNKYNYIINTFPSII